MNLGDIFLPLCCDVELVSQPGDRDIQKMYTARALKGFPVTVPFKLSESRGYVFGLEQK